MTTDQRLARLERQCRLFKAGFALTAITLVTVLLVGAGQEQEKGKVLDQVRTREFILVDEKGKERGRMWAGGGMALLSLSSEGESIELRTLSPSAEFGSSNIILRHLSEQDQLAREFPRGQGPERADEWLSRRLEESARRREAGKAPLGMGLNLRFSSDGSSSISMADKDGDYRIQIAAYNDSGTRIVVSDKTGLDRAILGCAETIRQPFNVRTKGSESTLTLRDKDGKVIFEAPK
jgi:hypothetical protein